MIPTPSAISNLSPLVSLLKKNDQITLTSYTKTPRTHGKISFLSANTFISFPNQQWMNLAPPYQDPQPNLPNDQLNHPKLTKPPKLPLSILQSVLPETIIALIHHAVVPPVSIQSSPKPFSQNPTVTIPMKLKAHPKTSTWISALRKVVCLVAFNKVVCLVVIITFYFMVLSWLALRFGFCQL